VVDVERERLVRETRRLAKVTAPADPSVTSLFVTGLDASVAEEDLRAQFYAFGELRSIVLVAESNCAFVNYMLRKDAESAASHCYDGLDICGKRVKVAWARPRALGPQPPPSSSSDTGKDGKLVVSTAKVPPLPPGTAGGTLHYASQDPSRVGASTVHHK